MQKNNYFEMPPCQR